MPINIRATELLRRHGWIKELRDASEDIVKQYQQWHGLKPDGIAGPVTTRSLKQPRLCGLPDNTEAVGQARAHPKNHFKWWLDFRADQNPMNGVTANEFDEAMAQAWNDWNFAGVAISGEPTSRRADADLIVLAIRMDGRGGVLADSTLYALPGRHRYDESEPWALTIPVPPQKILLRTVIGHELGHFLNLGHIPFNRARNQLMNPTYNPQVLTPQQIDVEDMLGLGYPESTPEPDPPEPDPEPTPGGTPLTVENLEPALMPIIRKVARQGLGE